MMSKEYQWPAGKRGLTVEHTSAKRPEERTLKVLVMDVERKRFSLALKENGLGRFLRITEESAGHYNRIIIPASGLNEFKKSLDELHQLAETAGTPAPQDKPAASPEHGL